MPPLSKPELPEEIRNMIAECAPVFDEMPCVVVLHDLRDWSVAYMSNRGLQLLNVTLQDITAITSEEYFSKYFNPEDAGDYVPKILGLLERNNNDEMVTYFQQVRFAEGNDWNWHMSSVKIFARDADGQPLLTITLAIPIDAMHHMTAKAERLLRENNFLRENYKTFAKLTNREKQILGLTALGKSAAEIAETLFISETTAETHRRNIKQKLNTPTIFELSQYARAFDLI